MPGWVARAEGVYHVATGVDVKDFLQVIVHHYDPAVWVDGWQVVVADDIWVAGSAAHLPHDLPGRGELGDVQSLLVGYVDIARLVDNQVGGVEELSRPAPEAAELADEPPLRREHLNPAVAAIGHGHHDLHAGGGLSLGDGWLG